MYGSLYLARFLAGVVRLGWGFGVGWEWWKRRAKAIGLAQELWVEIFLLKETL